MKEYIDLCGKTFEIKKSPRRKRIAVGIDSSGGWFIGAPDYYSKERLAEALREDAELPQLLNKLEKRVGDIPPPRTFEDGETLLFRGEKFPLYWICEPNALPFEFRDSAFYISEGRRGREVETLEAWYSRQLYYALQKILPQWTKKIGVAPRKISIKSVKTLWGSCSAKGSITFSSRLALVPPSLLEYVVVHELVHMKHMDHSDKFWLEVGAQLPDYKERRNELKQKGGNYKWR